MRRFDFGGTLMGQTMREKKLSRLGCFGWGFVALVTMLLAITAAVMIWWNGVNRDVRDTPRQTIRVI